nr:hypothetical protein [uncultured Dongia sp.]
MMPIQLPLWSLMLGRWLNRSLHSDGLTTVDSSHAAWDRSDGEKPRRGQAPPLDLARLSQHMRRDIGLDFDRV